MKHKKYGWYPVGLGMAPVVDKSRIEPAKSEPEPANEPDQPAEVGFLCLEPGCTAKPFGSQAALNAHKRVHKLVQANGQAA